MQLVTSASRTAHPANQEIESPSNVQSGPHPTAADTPAPPMRGDNVSTESARPSRLRQRLKTLSFGALCLGGGVGLRTAIDANMVTRSVKPAPKPIGNVTADPILELNKQFDQLYFRVGNIAVDRSLNESFPKALSYLMRSSAWNRTIQKFIGGMSLLPVNISKELPFAVTDRLVIIQNAESSYRPLTNLLLWNDTQKIISTVGENPLDFGVSSPAAALMHELIHAENYRKNPAAVTVLASVRHPEFDSLEEKRTIEAVNSRNGDFPSESNRTGHHSLIVLKSQNVTDTTMVGVPKNATTVLNNQTSPFQVRTHPDRILAKYAVASVLRSFYEQAYDQPLTYNATILPKIADYIQAGVTNSGKYANSLHNRTADPKIKAEVAAFSREVEEFAERIVNVPKRLTINAMAPAPMRAPLPRGTSRIPITRETPPITEPGLAPETAPSGAGAPEPPRT